MTCFQRLLMAGALVLPSLFVSSCGTTGEGGAPPSLERRIIDHPARSRMIYRSEESIHVVSLLRDGTYRSDSTSPIGEPLGGHEGRWTWKKTGTHGAELQLGADLWILTFVSPESGTAVNRAAGNRGYAFQFERM